MSSLAVLAAYGSSSEDESEAPKAEETFKAMGPLPSVNPAPAVYNPINPEVRMHLDPSMQVVSFNPRFSELYAPQAGPILPDRARAGNAAASGPVAAVLAQKNIITGHYEEGDVSEFHFEEQRRTFVKYKYAHDPSVLAGSASISFVGDTKKAAEQGGETISSAREKTKRKREDVGDAAADPTAYLGPWAKYSDEKLTAGPTEEQKALIESWKTAEQKEEEELKKGDKGDKQAKLDLEKSILHIKESVDYQGRSFMVPPNDTGVKYGEPPERCFLPKNHIHTWTGHTKGVSAVRFFPRSAHLILSAGLDGKVKLWEVYGQRRCVRTYIGHTEGVRDVAFNNDGTRFLSAGYDRYIRLWDTETGQCIARYTNKKIPYCVKFHPADDKQHLFVAGMQNKKILCWDTNTGEIVQDYDRHLGAVNSITFVEEGRRMVTTSDDKSIRVWEWDIPVDIKYIADPSMHSMPCVAVHPSGKYMAVQSMDNTILTFTARDKFRQNKKKTFKGHVCAGYACQVNFSPDGVYLLSGDAEGNCIIWDWDSRKRYSKWKAHDSVCMGVEWNPNETSKVATCGWDGTIKYWG